MSSDFETLYAASGGDEFKFVKHNETDFSAFRDFQTSIDEKFAKSELEKSKRSRLDNLKKWDESLNNRWRGASLAKIGTPSSKEAIDVISKNGFGNFFINGDSGAGKTYLGYAILRRYIGAGWVTPSQIKVVSEDTIMSYALGGFEGRAKFEELLRPKYKVYLFDNVATKDHYDARREIPFWEQLLEHVYSNSLAAIFTSNETPSSFAGILNDSGNSKFRHMISDRILTVRGTRAPELADSQDAPVKKSALDHFDG